MKKTILAVVIASLLGCGGGNTDRTATSVSLTVPSPAHIKSDYSSRPYAGTLADPIILGPCLFPTGTADWGCNIPTGQAMTWPQANYYNTARSGETFWTLSINNEPVYVPDGCNTGAPNRSEAVNAKHFFLTHDANHIKLRIQQTTTNNCQKIPYMAVSTFESRTVAGNYGDGILVEFDANIDYSLDTKHLHFYHFYVLLEDAHGNRKMAWVYLNDPGRGSQDDHDSLNWSWRPEGSILYPGAQIEFWKVGYYNANKAADTGSIVPITSPGLYHFNFSLDELIKNIQPSYAVASTKILGVEISIEQDFWWSQTPDPNVQMFMEMDISNVKAYKKS